MALADKTAPGSDESLQHEIRRGLAALRSLHPPCERLAHAVECAAVDGGDFAKHLGLRSAHSRTSETIDQIDRRNTLVCETVQRFFSREGGSSARALAASLARYESAIWPRHASDEECPHEAGSLYAALWSILRAHPLAIKQRRIQAILTNNGARR
ncbi:hypothetical protein JQ604_12130 [Bradyrhizobium jicamae]|uniref:hypothetical protein n=1 Tax=Bradyrhizobium jicamae TaxID=280332 RepID=UPI001BA457B9|nr:hypothetical protein [Bradyrhizobium jicamae]MBR0752934.1 hypothetical protein [Bradyrhizobium jicamae]